MRQRFFHGLAIILVIGLISEFWIADAQEETPTEPTWPTLRNQPFPFLDCDDVPVPLAGPSWGMVTIGESTLDELIVQVTDLSSNYHVRLLPSDFQMVEFTMLRSRAQREGIPALITACVHPENEIITAIRVPTNNLDINEQVFLSDLIAVYSEPDLVLWDITLDSRVLVWLTEGIAASVSVDESEQFFQYESVLGFVYFPYQAIEGYEERWPYTHRAASKSDLVTLTPSVPHDQNPFDFDAIIATVTAQPSRTPTPTQSFSSPSSRTPTPQPATSTAQP